MLVWRGPTQPLTRATVLLLQRQAGNEAVGSLLEEIQPASLLSHLEDAIVKLDIMLDKAKEKARQEEWDRNMEALNEEIRKQESLARRIQVSVERSKVFQAYHEGNQDEVELTDLIYFDRHPRLRGKKLDPQNPRDKGRIYEWERIRLYIVRRELDRINRLKVENERELAEEAAAEAQKEAAGKVTSGAGP